MSRAFVFVAILLCAISCANADPETATIVEEVKPVSETAPIEPAAPVAQATPVAPTVDVDKLVNDINAHHDQVAASVKQELQGAVDRLSSGVNNAVSNSQKSLSDLLANLEQQNKALSEKVQQLSSVSDLVSKLQASVNALSSKVDSLSAQSPAPQAPVDNSALIIDSLKSDSASKIKSIQDAVATLSSKTQEVEGLLKASSKETASLKDAFESSQKKVLENFDKVHAGLSHDNLASFKKWASESYDCTSKWVISTSGHLMQWVATNISPLLGDFNGIIVSTFEPVGRFVRTFDAKDALQQVQAFCNTQIEQGVHFVKVQTQLDDSVARYIVYTGAGLVAVLAVFLFISLLKIIFATILHIVLCKCCKRQSGAKTNTKAKSKK